MNPGHIQLDGHPLDPALAQRIATDLLAGALAILPTETVYGLSAVPGPAGERALATAKGRAPDHPFTLHLVDAAALEMLRVRVPPRAARLASRYWPGPLTIVLPGENGPDLGVRVPAHPATSAVLRALGGPLLMTSTNRTGEPTENDPARILLKFGAAIRWMVDDGPARGPTASTVVRCTGPTLELLRTGSLSEFELLMTAAQTVLFVCTGNTCRSPLAAALARRAVAQALHCGEQELLARGLHLSSAGVSAYDGVPVSEGSRAAAEEVGLDLSAHTSAPLTEQAVGQAARIYCMSTSHRHRIGEVVPQAADKTVLLDPAGHDIADPFGSSLEEYRRVREEISKAVTARVAEITALLDA